MKTKRRPASEAQLGFLISLLEDRKPTPAAQNLMEKLGVDTISDLTRISIVQASELISKLKESPRKK